MHHLKGKTGAILTCNPAKTAVPADIKKIHRFAMKDIFFAMRKTKVFLMGCGSLFQDATSFRSFIYYYVIMRMALFCGCKTMLYANGIGPITRKSNLRRMKALIKQIDCITVRDQKSLDLLKSLGAKDNVYLTADDSFSHPLTFSKKAILPQAEGKKIIGINFRIEENASDEYLSTLADALFALANKHQAFYYFIPFHYEQDTKMLKRLAKMLPNTAQFIEEASTPSLLLPYIAAAEIQIYERLHGQILSTILGIPYLPINYDIKIAAFARQTGMEPFMLNRSSINKENLIAAFEKVFESQEQIIEKLTAYTDAAKEKVRLNRDLLIKLIEEN